MIRNATRRWQSLTTPPAGLGRWSLSPFANLGRWGAVSLLLLGLIGCSPLQIRLVSSATFTLRPASALPSSYRATFRLQGRLRDARRPFFLMAQLEASPQSMVVVGLSSIGRRLFLLRLARRTIHYTPSPGYRIPIPPKQLLAYLQLILGSQASLQQGWSGAEIVVQEKTGTPKVRIIANKGDPLLQLTYHRLSPKRMKVLLLHVERGEKLVFESVEAD